MDTIRMNSQLVGMSIGFGLGGVLFNSNFSIVSLILLIISFVVGIIGEIVDRKSK